jgi:TonB family protein
MKDFANFISIAGAMGCVLALGAPANAATTSLQRLTPKTASTAAVVMDCPVRQKDAALDGEPYFDTSLIAQAGTVTGTSGVLIALSAAGRVTSASLTRSSGNWNLDTAALLSVRLSKFSPEIRDCVPAAGRYLYQVVY